MNICVLNVYKESAIAPRCASFVERSPCTQCFNRPVFALQTITWFGEFAWLQFLVTHFGQPPNLLHDSSVRGIPEGVIFTRSSQRLFPLLNYFTSQKNLKETILDFPQEEFSLHGQEQLVDAKL